jgi:hypothetical protein
MSITYPLYPQFRDIDLKMKDPTISHRAQNGRRIARKVSGQLWSFVLTYPPMKRESFYPVIGALAKARGEYDTFTIIPPNLATPIGTQTTTVNVGGNYSAGTAAVVLSGGTVGATLKAGDVLKFSNHTKVYMVTDDLTVGGAGTATINITPPLVSAVTTSHTIQFSDVPFTVALVNELQEIKANVAGYYSYELDVEEVY